MGHTSAMSSERHRELERLFHELCDLDPEERKKVLDQQLVLEEELRQELQALFDARALPTTNLLRRPLELGRTEAFGLAAMTTDDVAASERVSLPATGGQIAKYRIVRELGRGGMGAVFLARDDKLARSVAIKWLLSTDHELVRRFVAEARATARCHHENIVVIHEVEEHEGHPYIVFEYLQGTTLRHWMREHEQPLRANQVLDIIIPVVRALAHAHKLNVVHRDLKPENIMLTDSGAVKVLDFGIAKVFSHAYTTTMPAGASEPHLTQTQEGLLLGTLPYMSPEQWGADEVDHRTDIWAVGILLHELMTRRHPLAPLDTVKLRGVADLDVPMPRLTDVTPDLAGLAEIANGCLVKRKQDRIATAIELRKRLERSRHVNTSKATDGPAGPPLHESLTALLLSPFSVPGQPGTWSDARPEGYKILCVDDEHLNLNLLRNVLARGNHVAVAGDYHEALEMLRRNTFDLLLTDYLMPGLSGMDLAIQAASEFPDLVVVIITGYDDDIASYLEKFPDSPVVDIIPKPWRQTELHLRVIEACNISFDGAVCQAFPDFWATKRTLLQCRQIIRYFMTRFSADDIFQTALRHKVKECVHTYARGVTIGEPGARSAASLRVSLTKVWRLMERIQLGETRGLLGYIESLAQDLADDHPELELSIDVPSPFPALDDYPALQALLTLSAIEFIDNAKDALADQGKIQVQLRERASTRAVSLKVSSNGPPVPADIAERIFDEGVSTKGPGRGMGLAIVKAMVRRFRGEIRLVQRNDVSFVVTVPLL